MMLWNTIQYVSIALLLSTGLARAQVSGDTAVEGELPAVVVEGATTPSKTKQKKAVKRTNTRLIDSDEAPKQSSAVSGISETVGVASTAVPGSGVGAQETASGGTVSGGGGVTGASTTIISREQIERAPSATLADIISREAGVQTSSLYGGVNGVGSTVDIRGFGVTGPSNTLVLINGRRLNDWDLPGFDLSTISRQSVERIEITRGNSGAVLYGDGAVGGVINIITRGGADLPDQFRTEGGLGSFNSKEGNVLASASSGPFSALVSGNMIESDGYRNNNEVDQKSVVGDFRWMFDQGSVYLNLAADDQKLGLPGPRRVQSGGINQLRDDRRGTDTPSDFADKQGARGTLGFTYMIGPNFEVIVDGGIRTKAQQADFVSQFSYVDTDLTTMSLTPRVNITEPVLGLPSRIIAGIDLYDVDYESHRSQSKGLSPIHIYDGGERMIAAYSQQTLSIAPTTDVSAGGRIQQNVTRARDSFDPTAPGAFLGFPDFPGDVQGLPLEKSETNHAWHLGAEHAVMPGVTLLARWARSFRVANIDEGIGSSPFSVPTSFDLKTQESTDWEAGMRLQFGPLFVQSTYYDMRLTNELHFDPVNFVNTNLDPTRRRGVETIANLQVTRDVKLYGNLTFTDAVFRAGPFVGNEVPVVSRWTGNVGLSWEIIENWLTLDTVVHYVGDRRMDNDEANFQPLIPAHATVDMRLGGQIDQFYWSAAVLNLFDANYFDYGIASTFTPGTYNAYPQPRRSFTVKVGTTW